MGEGKREREKKGEGERGRERERGGDGERKGEREGGREIDISIFLTNTP